MIETNYICDICSFKSDDPASVYRLLFGTWAGKVGPRTHFSLSDALNANATDKVICKECVQDIARSLAGGQQP